MYDNILRDGVDSYSSQFVLVNSYPSQIVLILVDSYSFSHQFVLNSFSFGQFVLIFANSYSLWSIRPHIRFQNVYIHVNNISAFRVLVHKTV